ncbi:PERF protein, partial [Brachypteracias leptosomus]|nr:PERF protein [Brachypteracias leptosomus]
QPRACACLLCRDLLGGGRLRRSPSGAGAWASGRRCHQSSRVAQGTRALGTLVGEGQEVAKGWRVGLEGGVVPGGVSPGASGVVAVAGSHSRAAEFALQRRREDRSSFVSIGLRCLHYWTRISPTARVSPHFLRAVRSLPPTFTPSTSPDYGELLAAYGTHVVTGARLGGRLRSLTTVRSCRAAMTGTGAQEVADCLGVEISVSKGFLRAGAKTHACRRAREANLANESFNQVFNERLVEVEGGKEQGDLLYGRPEAFTTWLRGLPALPALVDADVRPLHLLLPRREPRRAALRAAIAHYVSQRALRVNCSKACGGGGGGGHLVGPCHCGCAPDAGVTAECCSRRQGLGVMVVTVASGTGWKGDTFSPSDLYVRVGFGGRWWRTGTVWNQERPRWGARLELGRVELGRGLRLRMEVWDQDNGWDDDLLGFCEEQVEAGQERTRVCFPGGGRLEFGYRVTCGPALGGPLCHDYVPQPPDAAQESYG